MGSVQRTPVPVDALARAFRGPGTTPAGPSRAPVADPPEMGLVQAATGEHDHPMMAAAFMAPMMYPWNFPWRAKTYYRV